MINSLGNIEQEQRERNARHAGSMIGATRTPAKTLCVDCGVSRTTITGSYKKRGFVCNFCGRSK